MAVYTSTPDALIIQNGVLLREIHDNDLTELFVIRSSTTENAIPISDMYRMGITKDSLKSRLCTTYKGWVHEHEGKLVGFSCADGATGEVWMIAVLPAYDGSTVEQALLMQAEQWLFSQGNMVAWTRTTNIPRMSSYKFFQNAGWGIWHEEGIECVFKKCPESI